MVASKGLAEPQPLSDQLLVFHCKWQWLGYAKTSFLASGAIRFWIKVYEHSEDVRRKLSSGVRGGGDLRCGGCVGEEISDVGGVKVEPKFHLTLNSLCSP